MDNTEQNNSTQEDGAQDVTIKPSDISVGDAMAGIFSEPSETFLAVKESSKNNYWLIPTIIMVIISVAAAFMITSDEDLMYEIKTKQTEAVKKRLEEAVKDGTMTKEQMNEKLEQIESFMDQAGPFFIAMKIIGPLFSAFIMLFLKGLILWGVFRLFKGVSSYMKVICVLGLTSLIESVQVIINTTLAIFTGRIQSNIGPSLLMSVDSADQTTMNLLASIDLITIWFLIILGFGMAKITDLPVQKSLIIIFGLWIIWVCIQTFITLPIAGF